MPAVTNEVTLVATLPAPAVTVVVGPPLVDLLFDQPAATDANLVFGANYIAPRDDVTLWATLPLPVDSIKSPVAAPHALRAFCQTVPLIRPPHRRPSCRLAARAA